MLVKVRSNAVNEGEVDDTGGGRRLPRNKEGGGSHLSLGVNLFKPSLSDVGRGHRGGGQGGGDADNEGLDGQNPSPYSSLFSQGSSTMSDK
jgi:hypothetical protein